MEKAVQNIWVCKYHTTDSLTMGDSVMLGAPNNQAPLETHYSGSKGKCKRIPKSQENLGNKIFHLCFGANRCPAKARALLPGGVHYTRARALRDQLKSFFKTW